MFFWQLMVPANCFFGHGMCSGIKDAKDVSWKLALACRNNNETTYRLSDSYGAESATKVKKSSN